MIRNIIGKVFILIDLRALAGDLLFFEAERLYLGLGTFGPEYEAKNEGRSDKLFFLFSGPLGLCILGLDAGICGHCLHGSVISENEVRGRDGNSLSPLGR